MITIEENEIVEEQIRQYQKSIRYDIRTFSIYSLIEQFRDNILYIPNYQRGFIWSISAQSLFIESMIIGIPTPLLFFAETEDEKIEIIDGGQRIRTLEVFINDDLVLSNLQLLAFLNHFRFSDLTDAQKRKFLNRSISVIILAPETGIEQRLEIFKRMNITGIAKSVSDMRRALYSGPFIDFIKKCSNFPLFEELFPFSESMRRRGEAEDLIIRFFALSDNIHKFKGDLNDLLDKYLSTHRYKFDESRLKNEFERTLVFIARYLKSILLERKHRISRVLFESLTVGVNLSLKEKPELVPHNFEWIESEQFMNLNKTHALQNSKRVRERIIFVKDNLLKGV